MKEVVPQNGLAGRVHWRQDLVAGLVVSLVALPFSVGIARASLAPPMAGILCFLVCGLISAFLSSKRRGPFLTVGGVAAGLVPILHGGVRLLGQGDNAKGFSLVLIAISASGIVMMILAKLNLARFARAFPAMVVEGMLAGIGLTIISKMLPSLLGQEFHHHAFWGVLGELPSHISRVNIPVFVTGLATLVVIALLNQLNFSWLKIVPPQVIGAMFGTLLGVVFKLNSEYLLHISGSPLDSIMFPNFRLFLSDSSLWWPVSLITAQLVLVAGIEGLATTSAADRLDPFKRKTDPNHALLLIGLSNALGLFGVPANIPGGVKTTANTQAGARTQWASLYGVLFVTLFVTFGASIVNRLPNTVLAAVVMMTGWKLCKPAVWKHAIKIGPEQLLVFGVTVFVTVTEDLLFGIIAGMIAEVLVTMYFARRTDAGRSFGSLVRSLYRNPVVNTDLGADGVFHIRLGGAVNSLNILYALEAFEKALEAPGITGVKLHLRNTHLLCHGTVCAIDEFGERVYSLVGYRVQGVDRALEHYLLSPGGNRLGLRFRPSFAPPAPPPAT